VPSAVVSRPEQRLRQLLYPLYLPADTIYDDDATPPGAWTPYVFAPLDDDQLLSGGARVVWRDPVVGIGLWIERAPS
jgi:hypothetical protein